MRLTAVALVPQLEIRVKEKLQCDARSRPVCGA
jgi:hypothetical protein